MYFINIATVGEITEFTDWMKKKGKGLSFEDTDSFKEWLEAHKEFPLEFYLDGVTYKFECERDLLYFSVGFESCRNLLAHLLTNEEDDGLFISPCV